MKKQIIALIYTISCCFSFHAEAGSVVISPSGASTVSTTNVGASSSVSYTGGKPVINSVASQTSGVFEVDSSPNTPNSQVNIYLENRNTIGTTVDVDVDLSGKFNKALPYAPSVSHDASNALVVTSFLGNVTANVSGYNGLPGKDASAVCAEKVKSEYYGTSLKNTFDGRRISDPGLNTGKCDTTDVFSIADYLSPTCSIGSYDATKNGLSAPSFPYKLAIKKRKCERSETKKVCQIKQKVFEPVLEGGVDNALGNPVLQRISASVTIPGYTKKTYTMMDGRLLSTYRTIDLYPGAISSPTEMRHRSLSDFKNSVYFFNQNGLGYGMGNYPTFSSDLTVSKINGPPLAGIAASVATSEAGGVYNVPVTGIIIGSTNILSNGTRVTSKMYGGSAVWPSYFNWGNSPASGNASVASRRFMPNSGDRNWDAIYYEWHEWAMTGEASVATDYIATTAGACDTWLLNSSGRPNRNQEFAVDDGVVDVKTYSYVAEASSCPASGGSVSYNDMGLTAEWSTNQSDYLLPANQTSGTCTYGTYCGAEVNTSFTSTNQQGETLRPEAGEVGSFGGRFDAIVFHQEGNLNANIINGSSGTNGVVDLNVDRRAKYCALINNSTTATIINPVINIEKVNYYPWDLRPVSYVESKTFPSRNTVDYFRVYTGISEPFRDYLKRLNCPSCPR